MKSILDSLLEIVGVKNNDDAEKTVAKVEPTQIPQARPDKAKEIEDSRAATSRGVMIKPFKKRENLWGAPAQAAIEEKNRNSIMVKEQQKRDKELLKQTPRELAAGIALEAQKALSAAKMKNDLEEMSTASDG